MAFEGATALQPLPKTAIIDPKTGVLSKAGRLFFDGQGQGLGEVISGAAQTKSRVTVLETDVSDLSDTVDSKASLTFVQSVQSTLEASIASTETTLRTEFQTADTANSNLITTNIANISQNATAISTANSAITTLETNQTSLTTRVGTAEGDIVTQAAQITTLQQTETTQDASIATLETNLTAETTNRQSAIAGIGVGANALIDTEFERLADNWRVSFNTSGLTATLARETTNGLGIAAVTLAGTSTAGQVNLTPAIANRRRYVPGTRIEASAYIDGSFLSEARLTVSFFDKDGNFLLAQIAETITDFTGNFSNWPGSGSPLRAHGFVSTSNTAAAFYEPVVIMVPNGTNSSVRAAQIYAGAAHPTQTAQTPYTPGLEVDAVLDGLITTNTAEISSIKTVNTTQDGAIATVETSVSALTTRVTDAEVDIDTAEATILSLQSTQTSQGNAISTLQTSVSANTTSASNAQAAANAAQGTADANAANISANATAASN
ncbi:MAG: hypothetical protein AAFQ67_03190, partial [Pseudomonadota bacterium]